MVNNLFANAEVQEMVGLIPGSRRSPWKRKWQPTPVFRELHGPRNLAGYSPWGLKESDTTEHTILICTHIELFKSVSKQISAVCPFLFVFFQARSHPEFSMLQVQPGPEASAQLSPGISYSLLPESLLPESHTVFVSIAAVTHY